MTTAILECLSTLSVSAQQLRRLPKLLEGGLPKMPSTVKDAEVPRLFREPYIQTGYRPTDQNWKYYFLSLFQKHNESVNVWTHLVVALAVLLRFRAFAESGEFSLETFSLPLVIYVLSSLTYLTCSILAHLLQSKSELAHYTFYFMDYVGVCTYQYGSALAHYYYSSNQEWYNVAWPFFLPGAAFLGWSSCVGCCYAKYRYRRPYPIMRKLCQVIPAGLAYVLDISPVIHRIVTCHMDSCMDKAFWFHCLQIVFFVIGAYFFSCPVPEKYFPGSCDIVGHGHQIFHLFLGMCTLSQLEGVLVDYKARRDTFTKRYSSEYTHMFAISFFGLILSSTMSAVYLQRKIKKQLAEKDA
ncbi:membrane progestin receptor beta [Spea bombifrons]|uniref:membrane progestin receptor beta n=1 Tax=Spea bombifrons TaxID=233779 RepID=UPI00234A5E2E|nr:membrane progestin receptor beta [Spea bombifrons]XP_053314622.1 membrane progestin receptor beta [Spea bombifrons]XP_053314623.1 membrane progestin receptor beta [Spea bombifrons]